MGFGLVIALAVALGAVAILAMTGVLADAKRLDRETVPQVTVANSMERDARTRSAWTGRRCPR
jgi:methyl-accepting chemotaxis protein